MDFVLLYDMKKLCIKKEIRDLRLYILWKLEMIFLYLDEIVLRDLYNNKFMNEVF